MSKTFLFSLSLAMGLFAFPALAVMPIVSTYQTDYHKISGSCAMLSGYSSSNTRWFEIKEVNKNESPKDIRGYGNSTGTFQSEATRLYPDTTYVYRAVAQNGTDIAYGQEKSFTTKPASYQKNQNGGDSFSGCSWYVPMTTNQNIVFDQNTGEIIHSGSVSLNSGNQTYQYSSQTQYSQSYQQSYNSIPLNQKISGISASNITNNSARLNTTTYPTQNVAQYGKFLWGKTPDLGNSTSRVALGSGASLLLSQTIVGLNHGTKYYYKPVIDNQLGTIEGSLSSFTTAGYSSNAGVISDTSNYVTYNSAPIAGFTGKITTNPTTVTGASYQKTSQDTTLSDNTSNSQSNTASVALAGNTHSIFPKTLSDWFTLISLLFMCVIGYFSWVFYQQKKEEELEYATVPAIFAGSEVLTIPQKPTLTRRLGKDPFYKNDKTELIAEIIANTNTTTAKSAPPDNLPV